MFGSFFFVIEGKGIKLWTKQSMEVGESRGPAIKQLHEEFPSLDWDYMSDRLQGELFLDFGLSWIPVSKTVPLVGLWRLPSIEASYGAGGMLTGSSHHINTLSRYGGLKAESGKDRALQTHIVSRCTYNLAYEVVRKADNRTDSFKDCNAYTLDPDYLREVEGQINAYKHASGKGMYGCRDEYRVGGKLVNLFTDGDALDVAVSRCRIKRHQIAQLLCVTTD